MEERERYYSFILIGTPHEKENQKYVKAISFYCLNSYIIIIIITISLLMPPLLEHRSSIWITHKENGP
jgi:hypothetical protein